MTFNVLFYHVEIEHNLICCSLDDDKYYIYFQWHIIIDKWKRKWQTPDGVTYQRISIWSKYFVVWHYVLHLFCKRDHGKEWNFEYYHVLCFVFRREKWALLHNMHILTFTPSSILFFIVKSCLWLYRESWIQCLLKINSFFAKNKTRENMVKM